MTSNVFVLAAVGGAGRGGGIFGNGGAGGQTSPNNGSATGGQTGTNARRFQAEPGGSHDAWEWFVSVFVHECAWMLVHRAGVNQSRRHQWLDLTWLAHGNFAWAVPIHRSAGD